MDNQIPPEHMNEEDYHFIDAESQNLGSQPYQPGPAERPNPFENINRQHVIAGVGFLMGIFVLYKVIGFFGGHGSEPAPVQPVTPVVSEAANTKNRVTALEEQINEINNKLAQQQEAGARMESALNTLQTQVVNINNTLQNISNQLTQQQMQALIAKQKTKKVVSVPKKIVPPVVYYIKAIIPGRAWLQGTDASSITVSQGSVLPGDGTITNIDAAQGIVTTSDGKTIEFAPEDR